MKATSNEPIHFQVIAKDRLYVKSHAFNQLCEHEFLTFHIKPGTTKWILTRSISSRIVLGWPSLKGLLDVSRIGILSVLLSLALSGFHTSFGAETIGSNGTVIVIREESNPSDDSAQEIIAYLVPSGGIAVFLWGIYEYKKKRTLERQKILFDLIKEFDNSSCSLELAKKMLDDFWIPENTHAQWINCNPGKSIQERRYYTKLNLKTILRDHREVDVGDPGEREIRQSFDDLLNFFGKLGYLLQMDLIHSNELSYFDYYIDKATEDPDVMEFARIYEFDTFALLLNKRWDRTFSELDPSAYNYEATIKWISKRSANS